MGSRWLLVRTSRRLACGAGRTQRMVQVEHRTQLFRCYDLVGGSVTMHGKDRGDVTQQHLRDTIATVVHDNVPLSETTGRKLLAITPPLML